MPRALAWRVGTPGVVVYDPTPQRLTNRATAQLLRQRGGAGTSDRGRATLTIGTVTESGPLGPRLIARGRCGAGRRACLGTLWPC
eukprot:2626242-Rhodomonas_salina.1